LDNSSYHIFAALHLPVRGPKTKALAIINHWHAQDAVNVLRFKNAKNFQLIGNPEFPKIS
jgi:hypothetical protein